VDEQLDVAGLRACPAAGVQVADAHLRTHPLGTHDPKVQVHLDDRAERAKVEANEVGLVPAELLGAEQPTCDASNQTAKPSVSPKSLWICALRGRRRRVPSGSSSFSCIP
jgi:hypothetical protein